MPAEIGMYFVLLLPIVVVIFAILYWAKRSVSQFNRRALGLSGYVFGPLILILVLGFFVVDELCGGNVLYGYQGCRVVSDRFASLISAGAFLGVVFGMAYTPLLALVCGIIEMKSRRVQDPEGH